MAVKFQLRRDTAANWTAANTVLDLGEPGFETDTRKLKIGDGATPWNSLDYTIIQDFAELSNTPTTLAGYGITDAASSSDAGLAQSAIQPGDNVSELVNDSGYYSAGSAMTGTFDGTFTGDLKGSIFGDDSTPLVDAVNNTINADVLFGTLTGNLIGNVTGNVTGQVSDISNFDTDSLTEGATNLYYTSTRANADFDTKFAAASITGLSDADQTVQTTDDVTFNNVTLTGYLAGPATMTIDPAAVGDDTGTLVIAGNLQVDGTTTTVNSTDVQVGDKNIVLGADATADTQNNQAGIIVYRPDSVNATIRWDETDDEWDIAHPLAIVSATDNELLRLENTAFAGNTTLKVHNNKAADAAVLHLEGERATSGLDTGQVLFVNSGNNIARIQAAVKDDGGATYDAGEINFYTSDYGSGSVVDKRMTLDKNGQLGINKAIPEDILHVVGKIQVGDMASPGKLEAITGGGPDYNLLIGVNQDNTSTTTDQIWSEYQTTAGTATVNIKWRDANDTGTPATRFTVEGQTGHVGIGQSDPDTLLHVTSAFTNTSEIKLESTAANSYPYINLKNDAREYHIINDGRLTDTFVIRDDTAGAYRFAIDADGNTGIGTSTPTQTLDVNGSIGTQQVRHSVAPKINLDFANSKQLDPRITFHRGSRATYFDSHGTLRYANHNEPRFDHDPDTGASKGLLIEKSDTNYFGSSPHLYGWSGNGATIEHNTRDVVAPDGTFSATRCQATAGSGLHRVQVSTTGAAGTKYFSIYVKAGTATVCLLRESNLTGVQGGGTISNGTPVGKGWYRLDISYTDNGSGTYIPSFYIGTTDPNGYTATGDEVLYVWGPQLELGTGVSSFIPSDLVFTSRSSEATYRDENGIIRTAPINTPRYSHQYNYNRWEPTGLVIEASQTTNYATDSENLKGTAWTLVGGTVAKVGDQTAPDGTNNVWAFTASTANTSHNIRDSISGLTTNAPHTISFWFKPKGSLTEFGLYAAGPNTSYVFDSIDGTSLPNLTVGSGTSLRERIYLEDNGWYRVELTVNANASGQINPIWTLRTGGSETFTGDGTQGIYLWGFQLESGYNATSYIPTYGATETREADQRSDSSAIREQDYAYFTELGKYVDTTYELTTYVHASLDNTPENNGRFLELTTADNNSDNRLISYYNTNYRWLWRSKLNNDTVFQSTFDYSDGNEFKQAASWNNGTARIADNFGFSDTDSTSGYSQRFENLYIGNSWDGTDGQQTHIRKIAIYDQALTAAELAALTENN